MPYKVLNSVRQVVTGTSGNMALGAATGSKYKTAQAAGLDDGDVTYMRIQNPTIDSEWECVKVTRSGSSVVRAVDSKYENSLGTSSLINFTAGDKIMTSTLIADQAVTVDDQGNVNLPGNLSVAGSVDSNTASFATAVQEAWNNDVTLNWLGGDVTLAAPILLQATAGKFGFGLRLNGITVTCDFNDATKYAITMEVPVVSGNVLQNINVRNFTIQDARFVGNTPFGGALEFRCLSNGSWINSFLLHNIICEHPSDYGFWWNGSIFECVGDLLKCTGGLGGLRITRADNALNGDFGLPSAMELHSPNFRDGSEHGVKMECRVAFTEPFDLTIRSGYIVTMGGIAVDAPAGITMVDGLGIEFMNGGYGLSIGYRGGIVKGGTRGANPVAGSTEGPPAVGMRYLVLWWAATGALVLEDTHYENEGAGTNMERARFDGTGTVYLNRSGDGSDCDNSGCTVLKATYAP